MGFLDKKKPETEKTEVIEQEAAERELDMILSTFEVEPEGAEWEDSRKKIIRAIKRGRISLDDSKILFNLYSPIIQKNGEEIQTVTFSEPTAAALKTMDRFKPGENMGKTIALGSKITDLPIGIIERFVARDLQIMAAIVSLFF